jgi:hypothetical protein
MVTAKVILPRPGQAAGCQNRKPSIRLGTLVFGHIYKNPVKLRIMKAAAAHERCQMNESRNTSTQWFKRKKTVAAARNSTMPEAFPLS